MEKNRIKHRFMGVPVENHTTASWANMESKEPISNVSIPSETEVINAKEWVDENEK